MAPTGLANVVEYVVDRKFPRASWELLVDENDGFDVLEAANSFLERQYMDVCSDLVQHYNHAMEASKAEGRLGPYKVTMDPQSATPLMLITGANEGLSEISLESAGNFSSARANACVFLGRWQFEVVVRTPGLQQLGWCTINCPFTRENGVGDAPDSYAFDGKGLLQRVSQQCLMVRGARCNCAG